MAEAPDPIRPQFAIADQVIVSSVAWLFEPYWPGDRLLARLEGGRLSLTGKGGEPADDAYPEAIAELLPAIDAEQALIDGVWSGMPFVGDGAAARLAEALGAEAGETGEDGHGTEEATHPTPLELETRRAFVALDLLELDGTPLYDVPLVERRRLLSAVVAEGARVRHSPLVKLPIRSWVDAWRRSGFELYVAKHGNSRYRPGEASEEWLILPTAPEAPPNIFQRLMGQRPRKMRHIHD